MKDDLIEVEFDGFTISTDRSRLDVDAIQKFLMRSYWSPGIPVETVQRAIVNSVCFGLFAPNGSQAGFARLVTDRATFAYLADVFVLEEHRNRGLGKWLTQTVTSHPCLIGVRRIMLATRDAHGLYEAFGFRPLAKPDRFMEIHRPDVYTKID